MKVGDLVKAPHLMDHDGSMGIVISVERFTAEVLFPNGLRCLYPHLLEIISESR